MLGYIVISLFIYCWKMVYGGRSIVTCGSAIELRHMDSGKYYLKSSQHKWAHGSSGQQIVTLDTIRGDLWQVREAHNTTACVTGAPIKCGDVIRLTHVRTSKNLHSHGVPSPLTRTNNEVTGFGSDGIGDFMDNWKLECLHRKDETKHDNDGHYWNVSSFVRFLHVGTRHWLSSSVKNKFNEQNCHRCPIHGELEVSGVPTAEKSSVFKADEGVYLRV
ncbi:hypothetical protein HJC23_000896 [Cyclotella cryptica]|uniref:MIR domain-containing protein n=1 Tax=Cyclotella cryptica TaxID=29204 RepID=A0ABD3PUM4_9STRA|eukprot:CCRYP_011633-RA/>CCRYP_011633-RA protein AED:0.05 eAED:0.05 QI:46/1/1/1/1/1/3/20/217